MTGIPSARITNITAWAAQLVAAGILGMAGVMKVTGNPDSVALFTALGAEPWGRWLVGLAELVTVGLLLRPSTAAAGGTLGLVLMVGALTAHFTRLGIDYNGDVSLFVMALVVLIASGIVVAKRRRPVAR